MTPKKKAARKRVSRKAIAAPELTFLVFHSDPAELGNIPDMLSGMFYKTIYDGDIDSALQIASGNDYYSGLLDLTKFDDNRIGILKKLVDSNLLEWIIVVSDNETRDKAIAEVGTDMCFYLVKPVDPNEFRQMIEGVSEVHALRHEITTKSRKVSHLEVINEIARETTLTRDENTLLWKIAHMVNEKLSYYNVNIFRVDDSGSRVVLKAFAGGFGDDLVAGYSVAIGEGITGWVAENREPFLAGDVRKEERRVKGFSFEENVLSELAVPIIVGARIFGVIHVESVELNAFTRDDIIVLETIADQMAMSFENWRLSQELLDAFELTTTINDALPVSVVLVDRNLMVRYINQTFATVMNIQRDNLLNHPFTDFFSSDLIEKLDLEKELVSVFDSGSSVCHTNVHHTSPFHADKILNITTARVQAGKHPRVMVLIQDVTDFTVKTRQLSLIREISIAMQGVFDRDKLLHMILTSVTAGFAMGFNRAFLFLVDDRKTVLKGSMGVGPTSADEAYRIWSDLSLQAYTFDDYMRRINSGDIARSGLQDIAEGMSFDLEKTKNILTETVHTRTFFHILDAWSNPLIDDEMRKIVVSNEFVTIPLVAKNEVTGVVFADNAYSGNPITDELIEELSMFSASAALAIENSHMLTVLENQVKELEEAYAKLEKTHDMLIRHEKLAAIGEVSARLAHEIRNPLATIGGFAQSIPRKYEDRERTIRNANIIVEEVRRLESILTNVLDFTKTGVPQKTLNNINDFVRDTIRILEGNASRHGIIIVLELADDSLMAEFDASQMKQVLINLIQNAFNAMPNGGALALTTTRNENFVKISVKDTGCGIPEEYLENIFDPFFTTRQDGTGLGLAISQRIIQNHNGKLEIESKENVGTTITVLLPVTE